MRTGEILAGQMAGTREWTLKLLADFSGEDWTYQPGPGLAHALFLCGHLAASEHVLVHVRCLGRGVLDDGFLAKFPIGVPVRAAAEFAYPASDALLDILAQTHAKTLAAVRSVSDALLAEPAFGKDGTIHPHYRDKLGAITHCVRHEAFHAGQIATIRRLRGRSFLR